MNLLEKMPFITLCNHKVLPKSQIKLYCNFEYYLNYMIWNSGTRCFIRELLILRVLRFTQELRKTKVLDRRSLVTNIRTECKIQAPVGILNNFEISHKVFAILHIKY